MWRPCWRVAGWCCITAPGGAYFIYAKWAGSGRLRGVAVHGAARPRGESGGRHGRERARTAAGRPAARRGAAGGLRAAAARGDAGGPRAQPPHAEDGAAQAAAGQPASQAAAEVPRGQVAPHGEPAERPRQQRVQQGRAVHAADVREGPPEDGAQQGPPEHGPGHLRPRGGHAVLQRHGPRPLREPRPGGPAGRRRTRRGTGRGGVSRTLSTGPGTAARASPCRRAGSPPCTASPAGRSTCSLRFV
eukprot:3941071-Rhodomonas_salina.3